MKLSQKRCNRDVDDAPKLIRRQTKVHGETLPPYCVPTCRRFLPGDRRRLLLLLLLLRRFVLFWLLLLLLLLLLLCRSAEAGGYRRHTCLLVRPLGVHGSRHNALASKITLPCG